MHIRLFFVFYLLNVELQPRIQILKHFKRRSTESKSLRALLLAIRFFILIYFKFLEVNECFHLLTGAMNESSESLLDKLIIVLVKIILHF